MYPPFFHAMFVQDSTAVVSFKMSPFSHRENTGTIHFTVFIGNPPKQVDCFFRRKMKQLLLATKENVLGHVA